MNVTEEQAARQFVCAPAVDGVCPEIVRASLLTQVAWHTTTTKVVRTATSETL